MFEFQPLYKQTANGVMQWRIRVEDRPDGTAAIITTHGLIDGAQQSTQDIISSGKNIGKKNETTPYQQAMNEAESKWSRQRDRNHYGLTAEESATKKVLAPMLAQSWIASDGDLTNYAKKVNWEDHGHLFVQPKFDGHRCLAIHDGQAIRLFTRKGVEITTCEHLIDQLRSVMPANTTFDGELYLHGTAVTTIGGLISKKQEGTENLNLMLYDLVATANPFVERMSHLSSLVFNKQPQLILAKTQKIASIDELMAFQSECVEHGYEGAMFRHGRTGYEPGKRAAGLLKVKTFTDAEFTVVGACEGRGKFAGAAIFECVTKAGHKFEVTAPGDMSQKQQYYINREQYIGRRLTIKFQKLTETTQPVPFQPVAKGFVDA